MKFRVARHTDNLVRIITFYSDILGLEIIGDFKNHNGYNGVFLGKEGLDWHLEFTTSGDSPDHKPDKDDLLVFYIESEKEFFEKKERFKNSGIQPVDPKNPYWKENGLTFTDPDGFRIGISNLKNKNY